MCCIVNNIYKKDYMFLATLVAESVAENDAKRLIEKNIQDKMR